MTTRDDVYRLVGAVPESRLPVLEQLIRASLDQALPAPPRRFTSAGTLVAEPDLAERSKDIFRAEVDNESHRHHRPEG